MKNTQISYLIKPFLKIDGSKHTQCNIYDRNVINIPDLQQETKPYLHIEKHNSTEQKAKIYRLANPIRPSTGDKTISTYWKTQFYRAESQNIQISKPNSTGYNTHFYRLKSKYRLGVNAWKIITYIKCNHKSV